MKNDVYLDHGLCQSLSMTALQYSNPGSALSRHITSFHIGFQMLAGIPRLRLKSQSLLLP